MLIYQDWCCNKWSFRKLGIHYHVDKNIIRKVITAGRLGDFSVHDSTNKRYRSIEYGLRRLSRTEEYLKARAEKAAKRGYWTDRVVPGELVHSDTKRLPYLVGEKRGQGICARETLFLAVDDATRFMIADIFPEKTGDCGAIFYENCAMRFPFQVECFYSDNGGEYKGGVTHPVNTLLKRLGIKQKFTRPYHPWTNGKAERLVRTLMEEWLYTTRNMTREERRLSLYQYVDYYNHHRSHRSLQGLTPIQKLISCLQSGDNA